MMPAFAECEAIVRRDDPDRAVAIAFAPEDKRSFLHALYAFDLETARIRGIVSQPLPGEIRLQWWRDRLDGLESDPLEAGGQGSPVAEALIETIRRCALPLDAFRNLLEAWIFDLYDDPMPSRADLEAYAGETASAVVMLAAMILDRDAAPQAAEAAGHAGVARVCADAMRLIRHRPQHAQIFFPSDILDAVGCSRDALQSGDEAATDRALDAMAAFASDHLQKAKAAFPGLPRTLRPAFLHFTMLDGQLASRAGRTVERGEWRNDIARLFRYWRMMRA
ncbi:phytoene/squalene synthase family protein [Aureimonas psammosilenae]|uniref:phytoene/squalene synthase family protein n=1 Tax=Aureimonas psammosilenae TaxID=2495496 RepID=UPI001261300D|nr:phytoene/squalene synthase family protein [Aureimonas psammosilenae]